MYSKAVRLPLAALGTISSSGTGTCVPVALCACVSCECRPHSPDIFCSPVLRDAANLTNQTSITNLRMTMKVRIVVVAAVVTVMIMMMMQERGTDR